MMYGISAGPFAECTFEGTMPPACGLTVIPEGSWGINTGPQLVPGPGVDHTTNTDAGNAQIASIILLLQYHISHKRGSINS